MADIEERIARFIEPFRVDPGSSVKLANDFDPAFKAGVAAPADVAGIGVTNERETAVLWDRRTGRPVARAIVWQDTRTAAAVDKLAADGGIQRLQDRTGLPISTYSSALKLGWLLDQTPDRRAAADRGTSCSAHRTPGCSGTSPAARTAGCTPPIRRTHVAPS
jgi:hypothetical protein